AARQSPQAGARECPATPGRSARGRRATRRPGHAPQPRATGHARSARRSRGDTRGCAARPFGALPHTRSYVKLRRATNGGPSRMRGPRATIFVVTSASAPGAVQRVLVLGPDDEARRALHLLVAK